MVAGLGIWDVVTVAHDETSHPKNNCKIYLILWLWR
jgi:hypothetical protein